jgi:hypothetical protein
MRKILLFAAALTLLPVTASSARKVATTATPANVQRLMACRGITDASQRLQCYDREAAAVGQALANRELVVIDKARANDAKRSLFGFSVPNFAGLFGGGDEINQIESTVANAVQHGYGEWTITLADGSTWEQTDDTPLALDPRRGDKVIVKRGVMGSYFFKLGSQPGFKAKRVG